MDKKVIFFLNIEFSRRQRNSPLYSNSKYSGLCFAFYLQNENKETQQQDSCRCDIFEYFIFLRARQTRLAQTYLLCHTKLDCQKVIIIYQIKIFAILLILLTNRETFFNCQNRQIANIYNKKIGKSVAF